MRASKYHLYTNVIKAALELNCFNSWIHTHLNEHSGIAAMLTNRHWQRDNIYVCKERLALKRLSRSVKLTYSLPLLMS
jgi:NADH:ubiquinone oxidoreductase subunit